MAKPNSILLILQLVFLLGVVSCDSSSITKIDITHSILAYRVYGSDVILLYDMDTGFNHAVISNTFGAFRCSPAPSPMIVYEIPSNNEGFDDIAVYDLESSHTWIVSLLRMDSSIVPHPSGGTQPIWSPDGLYIAFSRCVDCEAGGSNFNSYLVPAHPQEEFLEIALASGPTSERVSDWSPSSGRILMLVREDNPETTFLESMWYEIDINGTIIRPIYYNTMQIRLYQLRYSSTGNYISGISSGSSDHYIYLSSSTNIEFNKVPSSRNDVVMISWSPSDSLYAYIAGNSFNGGRIYIGSPISTTNYEPLPNINTCMHLDWAPWGG